MQKLEEKQIRALILDKWKHQKNDQEPTFKNGFFPSIADK
jgi:hypothetical protein